MEIRILVIDDDEDLLFISEQYLTAQDPDFHLVQVSTAQKAIQLLDEESFDAVICDFYLGQDQMNGLQILEWLRENGSTTPFIIFTGRSREEVAIQALNLGADYYLEKGDDLEGLLTEIGHHVKSVVKSRRTEEALKESEEKFRGIIEHISEVFYITDENLDIVYISPQIKDLLGYDIEDFQKDYRQYLTDSPLNEKAKKIGFDSIRTGGKSEPHRMEFYHNNGSIRTFEMNESPIFADNGNVIGLSGVARDITERDAAEQALRESEAKYRYLFENLSDGLYIIDKNGIINLANRQAGVIFGYNPNEIIGTQVATYIHPDDREKIMQMFRSSLGTRQTSLDGVEMRCLKKDGSEIIINALNTVLIQNGKSVGIQSIIRDITNRRIAEDALRESEAKYRTVVESTVQSITITTGPPPRIVYMNSAAEELAGTTLEELMSLSDEEAAEFYGEEGWKQVNERFNLIMDDNFVVDPRGYENKITRKDGTVKWLQTHPSKIIFKGRPAILSVSVDNTERKRILDELRVSEEKFRSLVESIFDPVFVIDKNNRFSQVYKGHSVNLPYSPEEYLGRTLHEVLPEEIADSFEATARHVRETGEGGEFDYQREIDGSNRWISVRFNLHEDGESIVAAIIDITDRKRIERELKDAEKDWKNTFDAIPDMVAVLNTEFDIIRANKKMAEVLKIKQDEFVGKKCYEIFHKSSEPFPECPHLITKTTGQSAIREITDPNLGEPYLVTTSPIQNDDGEQIGVVHLAKNLNDPVKDELSELAHVMSHDLGNKMKNISSLVSIARRDPEEALFRIDSIAQQSLDLLQAYADLADAGAIIEKGEQVDLQHVVRIIAKTTIPDSIKFHCDELPDVLGSPEKISQIFQNLFLNAIEHGNPSTIEVTSIKTEKGMAIVVSNDGTPIPEVERPKIFRRGFTTRPGGTGLGLSIVKKLVEGHNWQIELDPGDQTAFIITLNIN